MTKFHGKATCVYINGRDVSNYFTNAQGVRQTATASIAAFGDTDESYATGLRSGNGVLQGWFDDTNSLVTGTDQLLASLLQASPSAIVSVAANALINAKGFSAVADEISYQVTSPIGGIVGVSATFQSDSPGLDGAGCCFPKGQLTPAASPGGTTEAYGATSAGATGYLQVFSVAAGTPVVTVEHSVDGSTSWATLLTFAGVTAGSVAQEVAVAGSVRSFKRVQIASGTATFAVFLNQPRG
jgi:hypothetical protein